MMDVLLLRFEAPLLSFGGPTVDYLGVTRDFPAWSMLTGLLANALGYEHREFGAHERLQERLQYAARCDRPGHRLEDYQTVDLGQEFMIHGWTTRGVPASRKGASGEGTHIRRRHYLADAIYHVALTLRPVDEAPTLDDLEQALDRPVRPLFIGRKPCLPASPIRCTRMQSGSLREALEAYPRSRRSESGPLRAWWPEEEGASASSHLFPLTDRRDWANQIHVGRRHMFEGTVSPPEAANAG
ncbi:MAG: type I-E CRISPR-associated protein Cas5/CasD [Myxococcota bacterium]